MKNKHEWSEQTVVYGADSDVKTPRKSPYILIGLLIAILMSGGYLYYNAPSHNVSIDPKPIYTNSEMLR
jgi:hypothetical protein